MTLIAGVDIGNSTTEIVIADVDVRPPLPVAWDRTPTRGSKGSYEAARGAGMLAARLVRASGLACSHAILTPQSPVSTRRLEIPTTVAALGRLTLLGAGSATPAGHGHAAGRPVDTETDPSVLAAADGPVVLVARDPLGYRRTVGRVEQWRAAGHRVVGVLLSGDEATLVAKRIESPPPILDGIVADDVLACDLVALEVAAPGHHVRVLGDPIWLAGALALTPAEHEHARAASTMTHGHRCAAIGRRQHHPSPAVVDAEPAHVLFADASAQPFTSARAALRRLPLGSVVGYVLPPAGHVEVDDLWIVDLDSLDRDPGARAGMVRTHQLVVASLSPLASVDAHADGFMDAWHGSFELVASEVEAARLGAGTTPGAAPGATVVDLGGGTIDVIGRSGAALSAAGSGDLLTGSVAHALSISQGAAEWIKRGPASRVEAPRIVSDESGTRRFLERPATQGTVGWLVAPGPSGALPFSRTLALAEWRTIRLTLKRQVFAENLARIVGRADESARDVLVVGGPAGDDEILETLQPSLPAAVIGRADVAGILGHRWAVAYGLVAAYQAR